jgi:hypothetical protein
MPVVSDSPVTLRQLGAQIGSRVRSVADPKDAFRVVTNDAQLDRPHILPWQVLSVPTDIGDHPMIEVA